MRTLRYGLPLLFASTAKQHRPAVLLETRKNTVHLTTTAQQFPPQHLLQNHMHRLHSMLQHSLQNHMHRLRSVFLSPTQHERALPCNTLAQPHKPTASISSENLSLPVALTVM
ncbi:unnamed protein product [Ectocarpus fasciculatus]